MSSNSWLSDNLFFTLRKNPILTLLLGTSLITFIWAIQIFLLLNDQRAPLGEFSESIRLVQVLATPSKEPQILDMIEYIEVVVQGEQIKGGFVRPIPLEVQVGTNILQYDVTVNSVVRFRGSCLEGDYGTAETYPEEPPYRERGERLFKVQLGHEGKGKELPLGIHCFEIKYTLKGAFTDISDEAVFFWPVNFSAGIPTHSVVFIFRFPYGGPDTLETLGVRARSGIRTLDVKDNTMEFGLRDGRPSITSYGNSKGEPFSQIQIFSGDPANLGDALHPGDIMLTEISIPNAKIPLLLGWTSEGSAKKEEVS